MLYTGLSKGVMHYAGLGPHNAWTLTSGKICGSVGTCENLCGFEI